MTKAQETILGMLTSKKEAVLCGDFITRGWRLHYSEGNFRPTVSVRQSVVEALVNAGAVKLNGSDRGVFEYSAAPHMVAGVGSDSPVTYREWPRINPVCRFVVWIVETSPTSTTNPMPKRRALAMIRERREAGKYAELIKTWSCVQSKHL